jgi:ankyrin repeat protein
MLQYSAGSGNLTIVETLIEVGADVNKNPPDLGDIREPGSSRALWMAANAEGDTMEPKHVQTARELLENGADMNLPAGEDRNEEPALQAAQRKGNAELLALFAEFNQN